MGLAVRFGEDERRLIGVQWKAPTEYGELDITINLSKPSSRASSTGASSTCW